MSSTPVDVEDLRLVLSEVGHARRPSLEGAVRRLRAALEPPLFGSSLSDPDANTAGQVHTGAGETEVAAARFVMPRTGTQRRKVLEAIAAADEDGLTDHQVAETTGIYLYSAAPRRTELVRGGWVRDSGRRRSTPHGSEAVVWILTDEGAAHLARGAAS